jgi:hypothetical protein
MLRLYRVATQPRPSVRTAEHYCARHTPNVVNCVAGSSAGSACHSIRMSTRSQPSETSTQPRSEREPESGAHLVTFRRVSGEAHYWRGSLAAIPNHCFRAVPCLPSGNDTLPPVALEMTSMAVRQTAGQVRRWKVSYLVFGMTGELSGDSVRAFSSSFNAWTRKSRSTQVRPLYGRVSLPSPGPTLLTEFRSTPWAEKRT